MPKWNKLDAGIINADQIEAAIDTVDDVLAPLLAVLEVILSVLDLISLFVFGLPAALEQIVAAVINTIEQMILDILQNGASFCLHINLNWNPDWKYRRKTSDPARVVDFVNDSQLPFIGTGTSGWLLDVAHSAFDEANPLRPLSDADTATNGIIIVKGVPFDGDIQDLKKIFDMFTDFSGFSRWLDTAERLSKGVTDEFRALLRLGPSAFDEETEKIHRSFIQRAGDTVRGNIVAQGDFGENEPNSTTFKDISILTSFQGIQDGDVLKLAGEGNFYTVTNANLFDLQVLEVEPPIRRAHGAAVLTGDISWTIYRGGIISLIDSLPQELSEFVPRPGNMPIWLSLSLGSLLPVIGRLLEKLRELANALRVGISALTALHRLLALIRQKIALLEAAIVELKELILLALALLEFFDETFIIVINNPDGGIAKFINDAIAADDIPFFGDQGVVVGVVALTTADNPGNHLQALFELIGVEYAEFSTDVTEADQARQDTWDEHFP